MDLLKKEMERKKKALAAAREQQGSAGGSRKFLKASELRRIQEEEEERLRKRKHVPSTKEEESVDDLSSSKKKRARAVHETTNAVESNDDGTTKSDALPNDKSTTDAATKPSESENNTHKDVEGLSSDEVIQRLRALGLPIQLFGEKESHRQDRLREAMEQQKNVMAGLSEMDEFRLGSGHGIRNPFLERDTLQAQGVVAAQGSDGAAAKVDADATKAARKNESTTEGGKDDDGSDDPHKRIYRFFKDLLRQWEDDLALRPEAVKRTAAGRNETKTLKQCKDYIRPLFKLCKTRRLEPSLMSHILKIVEYCEAGEFVKANDSYIDVAIGRAAWPIGVTMVGIHARSGRAKIESANVAHVMNSELQRKYLTSVKRLISYCQKKREDVAPSKKVMS